jgi:cell division protein FtsB
MINEMLDQLNQQVSKLAKENEILKKHNQEFREQLNIVARNLRNGIGKSMQKVQSRAIEEVLKDNQ